MEKNENRKKMKSLAMESKSVTETKPQAKSKLEKKKRESKLDEELKQTFPASDPLSYY